MRQTPAVEFLEKINNGVQAYGIMMNALLQQTFFELEKVQREAQREIDNLVEINRSLKKRIEELEKAPSVVTVEVEHPEH